MVDHSLERITTGRDGNAMKLLRQWGFVIALKGERLILQGVQALDLLEELEWEPSDVHACLVQPDFAGGQDLAVKQLDEVGLGCLIISELGHCRKTKSNVHQLVGTQQLHRLLYGLEILRIACHLLETPQVDIVDEELREIEVQLILRLGIRYNLLQPPVGLSCLGAGTEQGVPLQLDLALQEFRVVLGIRCQFVGLRVL